MKKLLSLLLSILLLTGAALPWAQAAGGTDGDLDRVTRSVKSALDLDTDGYTDFRGNYEVGELAPLWNLYWSGDAGSLSVSALTDGTITDYYVTNSEPSSGPDQGVPGFPKGDADQASAAANAFLKRALGAGESVELKEPSGMDSLDSTTYRFSGTILLNGLPSPLTCSVTVRAADNVVTRFRRDVPETAFLGTIPSADASVTRAAAEQALRSEQSLRLEYILPDEDSTTAVLCYLPDSVHTFYVDAKTGKLVDLTALEQDMYKSGAGAAAGDTAAETEAAENGLSQAEQEGIRQLEGVQSSEALDKALRAVPEYGLSRYALASARYSVGQTAEDGEAPVTCVLPGPHLHRGRPDRPGPDPLFLHALGQ